MKAFSQSAGSDRRYADAVKDNAQYYVDWMHDNQKYMASMQSIVPAVLVTILPGRYGTLGNRKFKCCGIFYHYYPVIGTDRTVDGSNLAVVGTNVGEIAAILEAVELERPKETAELKGNGIELHQVEFSYGEKTGEVLHGINLSIQPGTVNALVGPSGSGKSTLAKLIVGFGM